MADLLKFVAILASIISEFWWVGILSALYFIMTGRMSIKDISNKIKRRKNKDEKSNGR